MSQAAAPNKRAKTAHHIAATRDEWIEARKALLVKEKELTKMRDNVAQSVRDLPWIECDDYTFIDPMNNNAPVKLSECFGTHDNLIVYHFMFDNEWAKGCSSCSLWADTFNGYYVHLRQKTAYMIVAKAAPDKLREFIKLKQWTFPALSSANNQFNEDFRVTFTDDEVKEKQPVYNYGRAPFCRECPGASVFHRDADSGQIYHTYSAFSRGLEDMMSVWQCLDRLPCGRAEASPMDWLKHKEDYSAAAAAVE